MRILSFDDKLHDPYTYDSFIELSVELFFYILSPMMVTHQIPWLPGPPFDLYVKTFIVFTFVSIRSFKFWQSSSQRMFIRLDDFRNHLYANRRP